MRSDFVYVEHVLESIDAIIEFSTGMSREELDSNRLKQSAIVREIEIIGEAVKNMSDELKGKHKEVEWREIVGTRDKMIHHYFGVDLDIIWNIVRINIPDLKKKMLRIKKCLPT